MLDFDTALLKGEVHREVDAGPEGGQRRQAEDRRRLRQLEDAQAARGQHQVGRNFVVSKVKKVCLFFIWALYALLDASSLGTWIKM